MCYIGKAKASRKVRVAKKDIRMFKFGTLIDGIVVPYYQPRSGVVYKEGEEYYAEIIPRYYDKSNKRYESGEDKNVSVVNVVKGLYSFAKSRAYCGKIDKSARYGNGALRVIASVKSTFLPLHYNMHFYNNPGDALVLIECHIPKGTKYLMDWYGETVSEKLVVDKITKL